jgi:hypothetical protein
MTARALIEAIVEGLGLAAGREIFREANASIPDLEAAPRVDLERDVDPPIPAPQVPEPPRPAASAR